MTVSIYQYSWSLFAYNIRKELGWSLAEISLAFTIFQLANFSQPFAGAIADARGPRAVGITGALLVGLGFLLSSQVSSPGQLCLCLAIGGVGVGALTAIAMASGVKWFPDKRGLASGLTTFGYGAGTAVFNWMIQAFLDAFGFRLTFIYVGLIMLAILVPAALLFRYPRTDGTSGRQPDLPGPSGRRGLQRRERCCGPANGSSFTSPLPSPSPPS